MTIQEMTMTAQDGLIGLAILLLGLIRIPKIELNFWTIIARLIGRALNGEIIDRVNKIDQKLEYHIEKTEQERINQARQRILRFCDEIMLGTGHSKEHYDEILEDINKYEAYCDAHPSFVNNKAVIAISTIKEAYQDCMDEHSFLVYTKNK